MKIPSGWLVLRTAVRRQVLAVYAIPLGAGRGHYCRWAVSPGSPGCRARRCRPLMGISGGDLPGFEVGPRQYQQCTPGRRQVRPAPGRRPAARGFVIVPSLPPLRPQVTWADVGCYEEHQPFPHPIRGQDLRGAGGSRAARRAVAQRRFRPGWGSPGGFALDTAVRRRKIGQWVRGFGVERTGVGGRSREPWHGSRCSVCRTGSAHWGDATSDGRL